LSDRKWDESGPDVDRADASRAHDRAEKAAHHNDAGADDDAVGYGRPPKATRFQPGKSGNPAGGRKRKASDKSLLDRFEELIAEPVEVIVRGRRTRMSRRDEMLLRLISDYDKGNSQARRQVFVMFKELDARNRAEASIFINPHGKVHTFDWNEEQQELYRDLERELQESGRDQNEE
jgi:hypothetical protein